MRFLTESFLARKWYASRFFFFFLFQQEMPDPFLLASYSMLQTNHPRNDRKIALTHSHALFCGCLALITDTHRIMDVLQPTKH